MLLKDILFDVMNLIDISRCLWIVNSVSILQWLQVKPPKGLTGRLRELFCEQEQQRQELLLQHFKERVSCLNCYWPRHLVA